MNILPPPGPQRRRALILLTLTLGGVGWVWWSQFRPDPAASPPPASNTQARTPAANGPGALPEPLAFEKIAPVPVLADGGRNPFRFGTRPPPPPPPAPKIDPGPPPPPPPPPGPPPIPPIQLTLTLLMDYPMPDGSLRRLATLKEQNGTLLHAFEGDKVGGRYWVQKVALETAIVSYLDGSGRITLQLGRQ